ncbi:hypothetical protein [Streptomyces hirsutus]|uniref:hypothetical protein n=1 Tax=Streptomyces hirsutus TaxID=35620 RepID=UPI0036BB9BE7
MAHTLTLAEAFLAGPPTSVFFGAAVSDLGVRLLLDAVVALAPPPGPRRPRPARVVLAALPIAAALAVLSARSPRPAMDTTPGRPEPPP